MGVPAVNVEKALTKRGRKEWVGAVYLTLNGRYDVRLRGCPPALVTRTELETVLAPKWKEGKR